MIMRLTPGDWSRELGPFMEGQALLLPLAILLIAPVLVEAGRIYPWMHEPAKTAFRAVYLSQPMFIARALVWFAVLAGSGFLLIVRPVRPAVVACFGLILWPTLGTLIAVDWLLSLDPNFASSGFGLYVLDLQTLTALAVAVAALVLSGRAIQRPGILGGLLLCLLLLWGYFAFMHYVITWSDDLPPGVRWYQRRSGLPWRVLLWTVCATRLVPTFLLFFQTLRRSPRALLALSVVVILGSVLEVAWLALPKSAPNSGVTTMEVAIFVAANLVMAALMVGGLGRAQAWRDARAKP